MVRGTYKYVPKEMMDELNNVKNTFKIDTDSEAFRRIVENARVGKEIRFTIDFNLNRRKK